MKTHNPPKFLSDAFNCPYCNVYAHMRWNSPTHFVGEQNVRYALCAKCNQRSYWYEDADNPEGVLIYPRNSTAPPAHQDMPEEVLADYQEARDIADISPRAASAMLRLVIQKLCLLLGGDGKNINEDIGKLVTQGLPKRIQQALDTVRVSGNEAVHPGELQPEDIAEVAHSLFTLVNFIVEYMIAIPKKTEELFNGLPKDKIKAIEKRDGKNSTHKNQKNN